MSVEDDAPSHTKLPVRTLVGVAMGTVVLYGGFILMGDVQALRDKLTDFGWSAFAAALLLATVNYVLRFLRWQYYLREVGATVPTSTSALVFVSGFVMSISPGKLGELFKAVLLQETNGEPMAKTAPIVIAERVTDLVALVLLTAVGAMAFPHGLEITLGGVLIVGSILATCVWRPLGEFILRTCAALPGVKRIAPKLREAYERLYAVSRPRPLFVATILAFVAWGLEALSLGIVLRGFSTPSGPWLLAIFSYSASTIVGALAMLPGGLGVTESGMTGLLRAGSAGAIPTAVATASTLLVRLATLWWAVILGIIAFAWLRREMAAAENR